MAYNRAANFHLLFCLFKASQLWHGVIGIEEKIILGEILSENYLLKICYSLLGRLLGYE